MSRTKSVAKNIIFQFSYELMLLAFGLVAPRWIIQSYGSAVNGLTATINQLLQILNLLQIGAVGAAIFEMYKPVADKDYEKISLIIDSSKRYFKKMGTIFLIGVVVIAPIVAYTKSSEGIPVWAILISVLILGLNGSFYFFFTSWYDILFSSHQKRYVLSISSIIEKATYYLTLFIVLTFKIHFVFMYITILLGSVVKVIYLYTKYCKEFKRIIKSVPKDSKYSVKNKGYLMANQVARQTIESSSSVIISMSYTLSYGSVYSVYHLVQNMIKMLINTVQHSLSEILGNFVTKESDDKIKQIYSTVEYTFFSLATIVVSCAIFLYTPFVYVYTSGNTMDINYIYPLLAIIFVVYDIVYCMYSPTFMISNIYGLFKETYIQSIISGVIGIILSIVLGMFSWELIPSGLVFYYGSSFIYRICVLTKKISWYKPKKLLIRIPFVLIAFVVSFIAGKCFAINTTSWIVWLVQAVIVAILSLVYIMVYTLLFERKEFLMLMKYGKTLLRK